MTVLLTLKHCPLAHYCFGVTQLGCMYYHFIIVIKRVLSVSTCLLIMTIDVEASALDLLTIFVIQSPLPLLSLYLKYMRQLVLSNNNKNKTYPVFLFETVKTIYKSIFNSCSYLKTQIWETKDTCLFSIFLIYF